MIVKVDSSDNLEKVLKRKKLFKESNFGDREVVFLIELNFSVEDYQAIKEITEDILINSGIGFNLSVFEIAGMVIPVKTEVKVLSDYFDIIA